jgi:GTP pyrophosphokinase
MKERFGYRIVKAEWTGKSYGTYTVMLHVVGNNDIGIVTNITSVLSKETDVSLRSINIESNDGLFACTLTVMVNDTSRMETLIKKLTTIRGVKQVNRY